MTIQIKCHGSSRRDHYILFQILLKHDRHITRHIIQCVCNIHIRIVANFHRTVICLNSRILCCVFCLNSRILCCACCLYTELCTFFCVLSFFWFFCCLSCICHTACIRCWIRTIFTSFFVFAVRSRFIFYCRSIFVLRIWCIFRVSFRFQVLFYIFCLCCYTLTCLLCRRFFRTRCDRCRYYQTKCQ